MVTPCEICGMKNFEEVYTGPIRDGKPGQFTPGIVRKCETCGTYRLDPEYRKDPEIYDTGEYRKMLSVELEEPGFMRTHDDNQHLILDRLWQYLDLRNKIVADVGAAMGSFLDQIKGVARECIAIEPCMRFHKPLKDKGYHVFPYANDADVQCDYVFSVDVIEHTEDPALFLEEAANLLKPDGKLIVVTPNRKEVLMRLAYDTYAPHYYRTVHNWYFDRESFQACVWQAGLRIEKELCIHRFGLSNLIHWLKIGEPKGHTPAGIDTALTDQIWIKEIENQWAGDNLCFILGGNN